MMVAATISPRTYDYLVAPGAIAALLFTLGSLIFSAPPARVLLGAFGVSLAACSTGLVKTHATVWHVAAPSLHRHLCDVDPRKSLDPVAEYSLAYVVGGLHRYPMVTASPLSLTLYAYGL